MRWSQTYIPTLRDVPSEAELISHQMLLKAGFIRKLAAGVYIYLPLMQRVIQKFSQIVREEMDASGAIEITMPVLQPAEIWRESKRYDTAGKELMRLKDRREREMCLGPTHEEVVTSLLRGELKSYKQLPINLYQIQVKFRDEIRPRFGLMRGREFIMKDAYSFDESEESFLKSYKKMVDAYFRIFNRAGLDVKKVESDTGAMGGKAAHEFMLIVDTSGGEEVIMFCDKCEYAANIEKATFKDSNPPKVDANKTEIKEVETPGASTIEQVTALLGQPAHKFAKTLIYMADKKPIAAMIRGDRELNTIKLQNLTKAIELESAPASMVEKVTNCPVGFAGPIGLDIPLYVDHEVTEMVNMIVGANKNETHLTGVNYKRDFKVTAVSDLLNAPIGATCPNCDGTLSARKGIEVGNTFMLGTKYSEAMDAKFSDAEGNEKVFIMGSYGIGITRTPQAAIERYHDDKGIVWPKSIAPFLVEIIPMNYQDKPAVKEATDKVYEELNKNNIDCLLDDRSDRAGVKFNDADLIGIPVKIIIGERNIKNGQIELKGRTDEKAELIDLGNVTEEVKRLLERLN